MSESRSGPRLTVEDPADDPARRPAGAVLDMT
jgi:hypothetical protein